MKTTKPTSIVAAVATLMLSGASLAATDDMGMQYTSASEGLTGSFRVNLYDSSDERTATGDTDTVKGAALESLRLNFAGTADLGNGLSSTYAMELRNEPQGSGEAGDDGKTELKGTHVHSYHIGMDGVFGSLQFGRIAGAGYMVPGGSLDSIKGNSRKAPTEDPGDQTFKFTSPSINGLQFGFSAQLNDSGATNDDLLDEVAFAAVYDTPLGLQLGAAYEKEAMSTTPGSEDDITGYRFGARYGQDNWNVAYEYRAYDKFDGGIFGDTTSVISITIAANDEAVYYNPFTRVSTTLTNTTNQSRVEEVPVSNRFFLRPTPTTTLVPVWGHGHGAIGNDYHVHAFAVQFELDKITASANYSTEKVSYQTPSMAARNQVDLGRTALGVDIKYALGSKSSLLFGFSSTETDTWQRNQTGALVWDQLGAGTDKDETTLRYQIDF